MKWKDERVKRTEMFVEKEQKMITEFLNKMIDLKREMEMTEKLIRVYTDDVKEMKADLQEQYEIRKKEQENADELWRQEFILEIEVKP